MAEAERTIFHKYYGPFPTVYYAIFSVVGGSYNLAFARGPEIDVGAINSDGTTVFKFPPNTIFELKVSVLFGSFFKFEGAQLVSGLAKKSVPVSDNEGGVGVAGPGKVCGSLFCPESIPCNDPCIRSWFVTVANRDVFPLNSTSPFLAVVSVSTGADLGSRRRVAAESLDEKGADPL